MRSPPQRGVSGTNETSSPSSYGITGSFPHYKHIKMPPDQQAKLQAMHDAGRANAGIYVAVVLAVYIILLTMLLCRYSKRQRSSSGDGHSTSGVHQQPCSHSNQQNISGQTNSRWCRRVTEDMLSCCGYANNDSFGDDNNDERLQETIEYPLTTLAPMTVGVNNASLNRPVSV